MVDMVLLGFSSIFISTVGVDGARLSLSRYSFLALRVVVVVVDILQFPVFSCLICWSCSPSFDCTGVSVLLKIEVLAQGGEATRH